MPSPLEQDRRSDANANRAPGTYLSSSPIITANWKASGGNQWAVPLDIALGHIFHLGRLPMNAQIGGYHNVVRPDFGPNWQVRAQVQFRFRKYKNLLICLQRS